MTEFSEAHIDALEIQLKEFEEFLHTYITDNKILSGSKFMLQEIKNQFKKIIDLKTLDETEIMEMITLP